MKRTAEAKFCKVPQIVQSSASRTPNDPTRFPSAKALGYCHPVRFADEENAISSKAVSNRICNKGRRRQGRLAQSFRSMISNGILVSANTCHRVT